MDQTNQVESSPIFGARAGFLRGHTIGSRHFGLVHPISDWDYLFEDNPETRSFLKASGWLKTKEYMPGERGMTTSFWRHKTTRCELFLVKSEPQRRLARTIMGCFKWCRLWKSKVHRWELWHTLEVAFHRCVEIRDDYNQFYKQRVNEEVHYRDRPLELRREKPHVIPNKLH